MQRELVSARAFRVEYEASFEDSMYRVFRTELIDASLVQRIAPPPNGALAIGIDWGRYTDYTAVAVLQGHRDRACLVRLEQWTGLTWSHQIERVAALLAEYPTAHVIADATGTGDPAIEQLQRAAPSCGITPLVFTAFEKQSLIEDLAWMFERKSLTMVPHPELRRQLGHYEATPRASGAPKLGATSGHDDLVTALALAVRLLPPNQPMRVQLTGQRRFSDRRRAALRRADRRTHTFAQEKR